jgi:hypothetical protein
LSVLPIGEWLGIGFQRALSFQAVGWWNGVVLVSLLTTVFVLVMRDDQRAAAMGTPIRTLVAWWESHPRSGAVVLGCMATILYVIAAWMVFDARPLLIDEIVQVFQSRLFASGRLWLPLDAHPEFRSVIHMVEGDGRWYGQFPPGGPAMLALGELVRAPWIVNPVCGGVSVAIFATLLRWSGVRQGVSLAASALLAFAPFVVFQSASHMNHVPTLMWLLVATAGLVRATHGERDSWLAGMICGLGLGAAATIRPLDAAAFALPAAAWLGARAARRGQWRAFVSSGVGVAIPMVAMMIVNARTTGGALTFGYTILWGESHGLGFHVSPWGEQHTVARGVALMAAYLNRLNEYLFETPAPSLLPVVLALALARKSPAIERYLMTTGALLVSAYFAYWHDGFYLGPRFLVPLTPLLALLVARLPEIASERWPRPIVVRGVGAAYVAAAVLGIALVLPWRIGSYRSGFQSERWDYDRLAVDAGAQGATILVRESWGAQVITRLWALGVSRSVTEVLYRNVDTCGLEDTAGRLEAAGIRSPQAEEQLLPLLRDSARVVASPFSPDMTERVLPGSMYTQTCSQRMAEDRGGYTLFAPTILARDTSTKWIKDLHARDTLVIALDAGRPVWLLRRVPGADPLIPVLVRLDVDSLRAAWHGPRTSATRAPGAPR